MTDEERQFQEFLAWKNAKKRNNGVSGTISNALRTGNKEIDGPVQTSVDTTVEAFSFLPKLIAKVGREKAREMLERPDVISTLNAAHNDYENLPEGVKIAGKVVGSVLKGVGKFVGSAIDDGLKRNGFKK